MDIISMIESMKGKVLDQMQIELIKHTYSLQAENMEQLKTSNELLRAKVEELKRDNLLLYEKVGGLHGEIDVLRALNPASEPPTTMDPNDCIALIQSWMGRRPAIPKAVVSAARERIGCREMNPCIFSEVLVKSSAI
jgi:hypothetical protein